MSKLTKNPQEIAYSNTLYGINRSADYTAQEIERKGRKSYESFSTFAGEVFDDLYSSFPAKISESESNKWAYNFLKNFREMDKESQEDQVNQYDMLRKRTMNNEQWSSIATQTVLNDFLDSVKFDGQVSDTENDENLKDFYERLLNDPETTEQEKNQIEKEIKKIENIIDDKLNKSDEVAEQVDSAQARNAIRKAIKKANDNISEAEKMVYAFGNGFGNEDGQNSVNQANIAKKISKFVGKSDKLKKIAEIAGRLQRVAASEQMKKNYDPSEICGIEYGNNLSKMMPSEALYMTCSDFEPIFAKRFVTSQLMQYELSDNHKEESGPVVCCLDCSGSMGCEDRLEWAMGVALAFFSIAKRQKRDFAIIHFDNRVKRIDFFSKDDDKTVDKILETVSSFNASGGTSFNAPILEALKIIHENDNFKKADIVFVTDGCCEVSNEVSSMVSKVRKEIGLNFYSVLVSKESYGADKVLEPISTQIVNLVNVLREEKKIYELFGKV